MREDSLAHRLPWRVRTNFSHMRGKKLAVGRSLGFRLPAGETAIHCHQRFVRLTFGDLLSFSHINLAKALTNPGKNFNIHWMHWRIVWQIISHSFYLEKTIKPCNKSQKRSLMRSICQTPMISLESAVDGAVNLDLVKVRTVPQHSVRW